MIRLPAFEAHPFLTLWALYHIFNICGIHYSLTSRLRAKPSLLAIKKNPKVVFILLVFLILLISQVCPELLLLQFSSAGELRTEYFELPTVRILFYNGTHVELKALVTELVMALFQFNE